LQLGPGVAELTLHARQLFEMNVGQSLQAMDRAIEQGTEDTGTRYLEFTPELLLGPAPVI
jgi:hypothetical protein